MTKPQNEHGAAIAEDFAKRMAGLLDDEKIAAAVHLLQNATSPIYASGGVTSFIFYLRFGLTANPGSINQGPHFSGNAGGASTPGGGALRGDIYTDNSVQLFSNTVSFEFNAAAVYTSLLFFDSSSNLLGHYQAASISTVIGVGGGSGSWSKLLSD